MSKWALRFGQYCLIVAMFSACGGHWLLLQSVAWGGMMVEYARTDGIASAVGTVFDGRHPCDLCKQIQQGRSNEGKPDVTTSATRLEFFFTTAPAFIMPIAPSWFQVSANDFFAARWTEPSVPPPKPGRA